ncbi:hypothetical protein CsSME_00048852 [Camellia sinensis var. sinensis]
MQENCVSGVGNQVCVLYNSLKFGVSCAMHKPKNMEWQFGIKAYEHHIFYSWMDGVINALNFKLKRSEY